MLFGEFAGEDKALLAHRRSLVHDIDHDGLEEAPQSACSQFVLYRLVYDKLEHSGADNEFYPIHLEQFLVLPDDGILGLGEDAQQGIAVEGFQIGEDGQSADDLRDESVTAQVLRCHEMQQLVAVGLAHVVAGTESHDVGIESLCNLALDALEGATADEQDILSVDSNHLLLGMLAPSLRRHIDHRALEQFEQSLQIAILNQSIENGWQGIFELKADNQGTLQKAKPMGNGVYKVNTFSGGDDTWKPKKVIR